MQSTPIPGTRSLLAADRSSPAGAGAPKGTGQCRQCPPGAATGGSSVLVRRSLERALVALSRELHTGYL